VACADVGSADRLDPAALEQQRAAGVVSWR